MPSSSSSAPSSHADGDNKTIEAVSVAEVPRHHPVPTSSTSDSGSVEMHDINLVRTTSRGSSGRLLPPTDRGKRAWLVVVSGFIQSWVGFGKYPPSTEIIFCSRVNVANFRTSQLVGHLSGQVSDPSLGPADQSLQRYLDRKPSGANSANSSAMCQLKLIPPSHSPEFSLPLAASSACFLTRSALAFSSRSESFCLPSLSSSSLNMATHSRFSSVSRAFSFLWPTLFCEPLFNLSHVWHLLTPEKVLSRRQCCYRLVRAQERPSSRHNFLGIIHRWHLLAHCHRQAG